MVGDGQGGVSTWQLVPGLGGGERRLTRVHRFQGHRGPVVAIDASKRDLGRYNPTIAAWTLASVSMSPVGTSSKWYYTVSWRPKGSHIKDVFSVPVLMSGEAVPLQVRDAT